VAIPGDDAYLRLRAAIVDGELSPNQRLVESDLVAAYGFSRAAVRIALVRLAQDRLLVHERNRGATVRAVSEAEAIEILQARAALESLAARHAALAASVDQVAELEAIVAEMASLCELGDLLGMSERNAALHRLVLEISGHETVARLTAMLSSQTVRFQYRTILVPGRPARSLVEHGAVVAAIAAGDGDGAERAMRLHLDNVVEALRERATAGAVAA
jgi:DNA-binding GntR family transcriptional regulator